jgi:hypothetical protein
MAPSIENWVLFWTGRPHGRRSWTQEISCPGRRERVATSVPVGEKRSSAMSNQNCTQNRQLGAILVGPPTARLALKFTSHRASHKQRLRSNSPQWSRCSGSSEPSNFGPSNITKLTENACFVIFDWRWQPPVSEILSPKPYLGGLSSQSVIFCPSSSSWASVQARIASDALRLVETRAP